VAPADSPHAAFSQDRPGHGRCLGERFARLGGLPPAAHHGAGGHEHQAGERAEQDVRVDPCRQAAAGEGAGYAQRPEGKPAGDPYPPGPGVGGHAEVPPYSEQRLGPASSPRARLPAAPVTGPVGLDDRRVVGGPFAHPSRRPADEGVLAERQRGEPLPKLAEAGRHRLGGGDDRGLAVVGRQHRGAGGEAEDLLGEGAVQVAGELLRPLGQVGAPDRRRRRCRRSARPHLQRGKWSNPPCGRGYAGPPRTAPPRRAAQSAPCRPAG